VTSGDPRGAPTGGGPGEIVFGVDVGGTKVLGVALRDDLVVAEARVPTPTRPGGPAGPVATTGEDVANAIVEVVAAVAGRVAGGTSGAGRVPAEGGTPVIGVGMPGMVDRSGVLRFAPNLPAAGGTDFRRLLARRLAPTTPATPPPVVVIENDTNLATLAEHRLGAARGADNVLMVTLGTGIGGGVVLGGRVLTGSSGFAAEVGHMVVDPSGPPCPCGRRGCWERLASGGALGRLAGEAARAGSLARVVALAGGDPGDVRGEHVTEAARQGDEGALSVMEELGRWVALGLANLAALLDPSRIVVGGGLAQAGEVLLAPTRRAFAGMVEGGTARPRIEIVEAELGERAGAIGAALAAPGGGLPA